MKAKKFIIKLGIPYKVDTYDNKAQLIGSKTVTNLSNRNQLRNVAHSILSDNNIDLSNLGYMTVFNLGGKNSIQWAKYDPQMRRI